MNQTLATLLVSACLTAQTGVVHAATATAIFAGGCFWSMEKAFESLPGVREAESGYTGGRTKNPTYTEVSNGHTGHAEAVRVIYDPTQVSYAALVEHFWRQIDPTVKNRQFCDIGTQYRSAIYWQNDDERQVVEASHLALVKSGRFKVIHTERAPASPFYLAEDEHQDFYKKHSVRYHHYRLTCGSDAQIRRLWKEGRTEPVEVLAGTV
ncbi:peptide-methionine (S)-S-oxide reductase MsrA [Hydrogenophaga sp.]|uniref:peptide-methionine (S)-S-oxide reductase MsrA n=1 Tax=Hydrogenophaga sp. TaxID=1904254 RepID=UPI00271D4F5A|nr:peptide-methionine (S)-S-oxide reductase MsrA [Hydrogenophaga sp.]MDO8903009.1 peptide-methionine (S)-S-oxide reductase MsrA [Hydrogenophaga sp.]